MPKFAIKNQTSIIPAVTKAVANSTPLTKRFCEKIMENYSGQEEKKFLTESQELQALVDKWPNDSFTSRLAELATFLTGYKLDVSRAGQGNTRIGQLFKSGSQIYVIVGTNGGNAYGINATCTTYQYIACTSNLNSGGLAVTRAEAGEFCKSLLAVKGTAMITYIASTLGGPILTQLLNFLEIEGI